MAKVNLQDLDPLHIHEVLHGTWLALRAFDEATGAPDGLYRDVWAADPDLSEAVAKASQALALVYARAGDLSDKAEEAREANVPVRIEEGE